MGLQGHTRVHRSSDGARGVRVVHRHRRKGVTVQEIRQGGDHSRPRLCVAVHQLDEDANSCGAGQRRLCHSAHGE